MVDTQLAPKLVKGCILRVMFADSTVPWCTIVGFLWVAVGLHDLLVNFTLFPISGGVEQGLAGGDDLLLGGQLYTKFTVTTSQRRSSPERTCEFEGCNAQLEIRGHGG